MSIERAIKILQTAHDRLAERIVESVIENEEALLNGDDFLVEGVFNHADKLRDMGVLLQGLQQAKQYEEEDSPEGYVVETNVAFDPVNFDTYAYFIENGEINRASFLLSQLFGIGIERAEQCTMFFFRKWNNDPLAAQVVVKSMPRLVNMSFNDTLMALQVWFGIQGPEGIGVVSALKIK